MTAWTRRVSAAGAALALALAGPPVAATGPGVAWADGIVLIQADAFWMGGDSDAPHEAPVHRVYVRDFWLDRNKVTTREMAQLLEARGHLRRAGAGPTGVQDLLGNLREWTASVCRALPLPPRRRARGDHPRRRPRDPRREPRRPPGRSARDDPAPLLV